MPNDILSLCCAERLRLLGSNNNIKQINRAITEKSKRAQKQDMHFIHKNIYLSFVSESQSKANALTWTEYRSLFVSAQVSAEEEVSDDSIDLSVIQDFCNRLETTNSDCQLPTDRIVICPATEDTKSISIACTLLGAYLIWNGSMTLEAVVDAFQGLDDADVLNELANFDCWRALARAMHLGWLVDPESEVEPTLDMEEFAHYASRANGSVYMAVPGRMLFFSSPEVLPSEQQWVDSVADNGTTTRYFSPAFYAELFDDLGVSAVVCLGCGDVAGSSAFTERGIEVLDFALADDGSSLLRGLDRLLSLAAVAPGAVAVHSGDGFKWPAYIGTLVVALLINRLGFDEGAATAWIRMLCPWMLSAAPATPRRE